MNGKEYIENWNEKKIILKQKFSLLLNNNFLFDEGTKNNLLSKLHITLGTTKAELDKIIEDIKSRKE